MGDFKEDQLMPINDSARTVQLTVNDGDQRLARSGGAASKASTPIPSDTGSRFAAMESRLKSGLESDPVKLSGSKTASRQFGKLTEGGYTKSAQKSPLAYSEKLSPSARQRDASPAEGVAKRGSIRRFKQIKLA